MRFKTLYIISAFIGVLLIHYFYITHEASIASSKWIYGDDISYSSLYFTQGNFFMGLSYALGIGFSVYAFLRFIEYRKTSGIIAGLTIPTILYAGGCFLIGCCGSPMLVVYMGLLGSWFLKFIKPLAFVLTLTIVTLSYISMRRKFNSKVECSDPTCNCNSVPLTPVNSDPLKSEPKVLTTLIVHSPTNNIDKIHNELKEAISLKKCRQCGCMNDTLDELQRNFSSKHDEKYVKISKDLDVWKKDMEEVKYLCLGCEYCYPAVATNLYNQMYPEETISHDCAIQVTENKWPIVIGEYFVVEENSSVAVSTLASAELPEIIAERKPAGLCIIGKTETENIGIDKVIKNIISNKNIRYLFLTGKEPKGHLTGQTLLSLYQKGVDENLRVIGSKGKKPVLKNVSDEEVQSFRNQITVIDMIGEENPEIIINRIKELSLHHKKNLNLNQKEQADDRINITTSFNIIIANEPSENIKMDKLGYFVIIPMKKNNKIVVEHYTYDNKLSNIIEGKDAKSIYLTIIQNKLLSQLSHSAYLGRELERAELSIKYGFKYVQDGAGGNYYDKNTSIHT